MAEGRGREEWDRITPLLVMFANANKDPKSSKVYGPSDFNRYAAKDEAEPEFVIASIEKVAEIFVHGNPRRV